jgi:hypothetical protein
MMEDEVQKKKSIIQQTTLWSTSREELYSPAKY